MSHVVFYCHDQRSRLGETEYYHQDISALTALGHEVTICTRYREVPRKFDAMFVWWWTHALAPVLAARLLGKPVIVTGVFNFRFPATFAGTDYFKRPLWQRVLIRRAAELATRNLFIDQAELDNCSAHFGLRNGRFYPCVVHDDYLQGPLEPREPMFFNIAWSGRQNLIRKGIPELLEAVALLQKDGVLVSLVLAGHPGDGVDFLRGRIDQLGIAERVTCLGAISRAKKIELLRTAEFYVQPSHHEGFGLATAEAMGSGACVITCDVGAVRSVVGDTGLYVAPGSPADLAAAMKRALADVGLRRRLQSEAQQRARQLLRADQKRERLQAILAEVGIR